MITTEIGRLRDLRRQSLRRGSAPLELTLALPILMVMLSIIFGVCSVTETRMIATLAARNNTFEKRHTPWKHAPKTIELPYVKEVSKILGPSPIMPANSGLVTGVAENSPTGLFGPLSKLTLSTASKRFVLGGGWDYQEIEFKKHSALTLTDKAKYFGVKASEIDVFKKLGGFGAGGGGSARSFGQIQSQAQQTLQNAQQEVTARLAEIQQQLTSLTKQLTQQKQHLANLHKNPNADPAAIRSADQQVKKTQSKIDKLKSEQAQQSKASRSLGFNSSLPAAGVVSASEESGR